MNKYTLTLQQIINSNINIFDFEYNLFNNNYKPVFEQLFINYFFMEEIAHETVGLFKHRLKNKLDLILPYYNKLYMSQELEQRILDNYDVTETITREVNGDSESVNKGDTTRKGDNKQLYKDTPKTKIDIDKFDIVTNITKNIADEKTINNDVSIHKSNNIENYVRTMTGNIGVQTDADAIMKYWQSLRNVTLEIFENELSELFMGIF